MSGKSRQHGSHVQFALALQYLLLQRLLTVHPVAGQRSHEGVEVAHAVPAQIGGAGEEGANLFIVEPELLPHVIPSRFLTGDGQRHVDTVERHPVDEVFPLTPSPPRQRIAVGAVVEEETHGKPRLYSYLLFDSRHSLRQFDRVVFVPRDGGVTIVLEIVVQAHSHAVGVVGADDHLALVALQGEYVFCGVNLFEDHCLGLVAQYTSRQILRRLDIVGCHHAYGYRHQAEGSNDSTVHDIS